MTDNKGLQELLALAAQGIKIFPIHGIHPDTGHCTCNQAENCQSPGKHPRQKGWEEIASTDVDKIHNWAASFPHCNWAAKTGLDSALLVVDIDPKNGGDKTWSELLQNHKLNDAGMIVTTTGSGGTHYWFKRYGKDIRSRGFVEGIDIKGEQGLIVIPPSKHISGGSYTWQPGHDPLHAKKKTMPKWLKELIETNMDAHQQFGDMSGGWEQGSRNDKLYHHAYLLSVQGLPAATIRDLFDAIMAKEEAFINDPMDSDEIDRIIHNAQNKHQRDGATITTGGSLSFNDRNDSGNAARFVDQWRDDVRFIEDAQVWVCWSSNIWNVDWNNTYSYRLMMDTAKGIAAEAKGMTDKKEASLLLRWSSDSQNLSRIRPAVTLAQTYTDLHISAEEMNVHGEYIQCRNGLLNLKTGELSDFNKDLYITKSIDLDYNPEAECPIWEEGLRLSLDDEDEDLLQWIQRALGYSITGETSEQCMFICYGPEGNNGKSTLLEAVQRLMGEMAMMSEFDVIATSKSDNFARAEIAKLVGTRFVSMNEAKSTALDESLVKQLTGGDTITGRHLFKKSIKFLPQFKIWLRANEKPEIRGTDHAIWRRMRVIPFTKQIPPEKRKDRHVIDAELDAEAEGIFAWLVRGAMEWYATGLQDTEAVMMSTKEYREESDVLELFLSENMRKIPGSRSPKTVVYRAYRTWAKDNGVYAPSSLVFAKNMERKGFEEVTSQNVQFFLDIEMSDKMAEEATYSGGW